MEETSRRRKDRSITWQPYLSNDARQDILEIYERLDVERKGYVTQQQLHAALNEALGRTIRSDTVRAISARMDITSRHGLKVSCNDFLEYMAQKLLSSESYDDLLRSEQGALMQEVGYKVYELLERFKRKQMLRDAMAGGDGIQRLLHLTVVPIPHRNRRKGQSGKEVKSSDTGANGSKAVGPSARSRLRRGDGGGEASRAEDGGASRSLGGESFVSRSSVVSRRSSGNVADAPSSLTPVSGATAKPTGPRSANTRSNGRAPRSRQGRNTPAARASSALASLLSRMDGQDADATAAASTEDRGSVQRWRKSTGHLIAEVQSSPCPGQSESSALLVSGQLSSGAAAAQGSKVQNSVATCSLSSHASMQSTSGSVMPSSPQIVLAAPVGESNACPQKRLVSHPPLSAGGSSPTSASAPLPLGRSGMAMATPGTNVPGRSASRVSSPALSSLGPSGSVPLLSSPAAGKAEGWRSAALMAQVLEVERIDVHSLVMEDLRATVGLPSSPTQVRAYRSQQPSSSLLLQHSVSPLQQQQHPQHPQQLHQGASSLQLQNLHMQPPPQQQQHILRPSTTSQGRSNSFPQHSASAEEERRTSAASPMDLDLGGANVDGSVHGLPIKHQGAYSSQGPHLSSSPTTQPPSQPRQQQQQQSSGAGNQPLSSQPRHNPVYSLLQSQAQPQNPQAQPQAQLKLQPHHSNVEKQREGEPQGSWVTAEPEGTLGSQLRGSQSAGAQSRNRPRFQTTTSGPDRDALRLDVPGPIELDPLLAKLPDWVRKGIGLPPAPPMRSVEPESGAQPVPVASAVSPIAAAAAGTRSECHGGGASPHPHPHPQAQAQAHREGNNAGGASRDSTATCGNPRSNNALWAVDASNSHRPMITRGFSLTRQSTTRFVPFGGDTAAVVAEAAEEGESGLAPECESSRSGALFGASGPQGEKQYCSNQIQNYSAKVYSPLPDATAAPPAEWTEANPALLGAPMMAYSGHHPELPTPEYASFGEHVATWPGQANAAVEGLPGGTGEQADEDWGSQPAEVSRESLAAWEESVLSHRSSVCHGTFENGELAAVEEGEGKGQENCGDSNSDDEALLLYEQLVGGSRSTRPLAPCGERVEEVSVVAHRGDHQAHVNMHTHLHRQEVQQESEPRIPTPPQLQLQSASRKDSTAGIVVSSGEELLSAAFPAVFAQPTKHQTQVVHSQAEVVWPPSLPEDVIGVGDATGGINSIQQLQSCQVQPTSQGLAHRPRFVRHMRPRSAAPMPSAAAVVAAAAAAASSVAKRASEDGTRAAGGSFWSADYVHTGEMATGARAHVRLNNAAMLRLQMKYGAELIAAAGAALGLGGSSAAARDVASRELLQALTSHGSGRIVANPSFISTRASEPSSPLTPSKDAAVNPTNATISSTAPINSVSSSGPPARCLQRRRSSSSTSGGGDRLPRRMTSGSGNSGVGLDGGLPQRTSGSGHFLPHDAVALGRQITRESSRRLSESGTAGGYYSSNNRPLSGRAVQAAAPIGAAPLSRPSPLPHPSSTKLSHNAVHHNTYGMQPSAAALHVGVRASSPTSGYGVGVGGVAGAPNTTNTYSDSRGRSTPVSGMTVVSNSGLRRPVSGTIAAANRRTPPGRSASALAPTSHLPPTISIARVRHMEDSEVSSCFTHMAVLNNNVAASADASADPSSPASRNAKPSRSSSPVPPTTALLPSSPSASTPSIVPHSPSMCSGPLKGHGLLTADRRTPTRNSGGGASSGGKGSSGGASVQSSSASSSAPSRGTMGSVEGANGEDRRRRQLEVMGTGALVPWAMTRKTANGVAAPGEIVTARQITAGLAHSR